MDARMQKRRMTSWVGKLFVALILMVSSQLQAAPICISWMTGMLPYNRYPTQLEAAQAVINWINAIGHPAAITGTDGVRFYYTWVDDYGHVVNSMFMTGCDAYGTPITITLSGGTEVEPSTLLPFNVVVKDQNGVVQSGKQVTITSTVQDGTGGHIHTDKRPKGILACASMGSSTCTLTTDGSGQAPFDFISTPVSGTHSITATCDGCSNTATANVDVKVKDLIPIPGSPLYALSDSNGVIGAIPGKHTDNHYLTSTAKGELNALARLYKTKINPKAILYLNDASLVWGGLFDVGSSTPWLSPHSLHDKGKSLDIRAANSGPNNEGAVSATDFQKFLKLAKENGFKMGLHCKNSSDTNYCLGQPNNRHIHVDF